MALDRSTKLGCSQGPTREEGRTRARDGAPLRNVNGHRAPRPGYSSRCLVANERSFQLGGQEDRKRVGSGKSVSVSVDIGGRSIIKNKRAKRTTEEDKTQI